MKIKDITPEDKELVVDETKKKPFGPHKQQATMKDKPDSYLKGKKLVGG